ncbi:MAG TPA: hypothetical protein VHX36_17085 [Candidatus Acidoferrales bacterium]|jgi:hypothetical protein|nr:hypothetical protein [Candidatus Acidoferrales bacterium]
MPNYCLIALRTNRDALGLTEAKSKRQPKEFGADELEAWPSQFLVPKGLKFAQSACTVPTQPQIATLSTIKTIRYKSFITRSE